MTSNNSAPPAGRSGLSLLKASPVTVTLAALCTLVWLVEQVATLAGWQSVQVFIGYEMAMIPARLTGLLVWPDAVIPAILTPITMMFVHGGLGHLGLNMLFLLVIGRFPEGILGSGRYLALYFASGIAGALLEVALHPDSLVPYVGASGAIAGVIGAHAMIFGQRDGKDSEKKRALQLAGVWIVIQVLTGIVFNSGGGDGGIAIWAHVGGFLTGLALGVPLAKDAIARR